MSLVEPDNGMITCSLGDGGVFSYEDSCSFTCNRGYGLTVSNTRIYQGDGSWSGNVTMCTKGKLSICTHYILTTTSVSIFGYGVKILKGIFGPCAAI